MLCVELFELDFNVCFLMNMQLRNERLSFDMDRNTGLQQRAVNLRSFGWLHGYVGHVSVLSNVFCINLLRITIYFRSANRN